MGGADGEHKVTREASTMAQIGVCAPTRLRGRICVSPGGLTLASPARIVCADLLVVDELELLPLDAEGARLLFQVVSQAYEAQSVVFTTPLRFKGKSYRLKHSLMQGGAQEEGSGRIRELIINRSEYCSIAVDRTHLDET